MAYKRSLSEEDLTCPVCCDIFVDPVILSCSHSLCKACMQTLCIKLSNQCPICRRRSLINPPPSNLALKNLCEGFIQERDFEASELCSTHREKLKLFCQEDRVPICLVCWKSREHKQHECCPIEEAASDYRDQLKTTLSSLEERLRGLQIIERDCTHIATHIKCQAYSTGQQIKKEFERLHQFLRDEEDVRIVALEEEVKQKSNSINKIIENISNAIATLSNKIKAIEEAVGSADVPFLQNIWSAVDSAQCRTRDPENPRGALIDVAQHLGNLKFRVWEKMQDVVEYTPVILDPNTSQAKLVLSEDLTSVVNSAQKLRVPYNLERFDYYPCVLGSQILSSGVHSWDVAVADSSVWSVGICTASNNMKGDTFFNEDIWYVRYLSGKYTCHSPSKPDGPIVTERLQVLRMRLDWDGGEVIFSDPLSKKLLCTVKHVFTEGVLPFLYNYCVSSPLRILPVKKSSQLKNM